jgi:TetR/AcrR family transcriptional regulator, regulator of cefoperazone and chloramphenicol sensitivity
VRVTRRSQTRSDVETRERLLRAAGRLFADRGFKKVTVRDICRDASANIAAINYHFGDKMGLYREVLQGAIDAVQSTTEAARKAGAGCTTEEKLRRFVAVFLQRVLTPGHETLHRLIQREIDDPTPALDALIEQGIRPRVEYLSGLVAELIGCRPSDDIALRSVGSLMSQAVIYVRRNPIAERLGFPFTGTPAEIDEAARHIAEFSIGGIRAVARHAFGAQATRPQSKRNTRR